MSSFFRELKQRRVYRVAIGYAIAGWLAIQIAATVLPAFHAPEFVLPVLIILFGIGFPVALVLAWAFDVTPSGLEKTPEENGKLAARNTRHAWLLALAGAAIAGIAIGSYWIWHPWRSSPRMASHATPSDGRTSSLSTSSALAAIPEKSIAVLPFESLSEDKANAYFATGIQDEVLTRLAKISGLKVISRTSTLQYQSRPGNLAEIAKQLGVAHVLEGTVQKLGDQVRVNVQLINAADDSHLWADTYDRKLTDIFAVESEIAKSIAEALRAKLSGGEVQAIAIRPTENAEAYDAYLRGLAAEAQRMHDLYSHGKAAGFYERAVQLDPSFAIAWALLARADSIVFASPEEPTPARRDAAKRALEMAQKLQPDSGETLLALAEYQFRVLHDAPAAADTYRRVRSLLPGSSEVPAALARIARERAQWDEAIGYYEQALVLDPRNPELLADAAFHYADLRKFDAAHKLLDRALEVKPNDPVLMAAKAGCYQAEGKITEAARFQPPIDPATSSIILFDEKLKQLWLERKPAEATRLLELRFAQRQFGSELEKGVYRELAAFACRFAGDDACAKANAEQARDILLPLCREQAENDFAATSISRAYAILGDNNLAYAEAERAKRLLQASGDGVRAPSTDENLAIIDTLLGNNARAISTLAHLLQIPYTSQFYETPITPALLRLDPMWDPLRADLAFRKLYEEKLP